MKQVKQAVHYWCDDVINGRCLGQGIGVAVLDTGIMPHPDFDDRIVAFEDMINRRDRIYDDNGHGTHVSGIIGGSGRLSQGIYAGMSPRCNLIVVKVLDQNGNGNVLHVVKGLYWVMKNREKYNIRIVNISVGTLPHVGNKEEQQLLHAVELLWDVGIVVVVAAGNYGPKEGTVTTPGISKKVITVGSSNDEYYTDERGRTKRNYSGRGPTSECVIKPDLIAPGTYITSCNAYYLVKRQKPYAVKSGTSMATPIVSGACALLLSKYPEMSNVEVKLKMRSSCVDMGYSPNRQGWGCIHIQNLLAL